jgi:hypothetical protein
VTYARRFASLAPWQLAALAVAAILVFARLVLGIEISPYLLIGFGPVTLAQASLNAASDIDRTIIDEFRKSSFLLDRMPFDQAVNPGGGSTLTYGYTRQITQRAAAFRAINAEYTPTEATKQAVHGRPEAPRRIVPDRPRPAGIARGAEVQFQLASSSRRPAYFADQAINGDSAVTTDGFDGLNKALVGSSPSTTPAPSTTGPPSTRQVEALQAIQKINALAGAHGRPPDAIFANTVP